MTVGNRIPNLTQIPAPVPVVNPIPNTGEKYKRSDATRLLCASAYLDRGFRKEVIKAYVDEEHKCVAPSFGIDQEEIIQHCIAAHSKLDKREIWLLIPSIIAIISFLAVANDETGAFPVLLVAYLAAVAFVFAYRRRAATIVRNNFI